VVAPPDSIAFDRLVALWQRHPQCQVVDDDGAACGREAAWRWRFHGCSEGIMCTHHLDAWLLATAKLDWPSPCHVCGHVFRTADDACTVVAL
jgi:hypothetical protein